MIFGVAHIEVNYSLALFVAGSLIQTWVLMRFLIASSSEAHASRNHFFFIFFSFFSRFS